MEAENEFDFIYNVEDKIQRVQKKEEAMKKLPLDPRDVFDKTPKNVKKGRRYKRSMVDKKDNKTKMNKTLEEYL